PSDLAPAFRPCSCLPTLPLSSDFSPLSSASSPLPSDLALPFRPRPCLPFTPFPNTLTLLFCPHPSHPPSSLLPSLSSLAYPPRLPAFPLAFSLRPSPHLHSSSPPPRLPPSPFPSALALAFRPRPSLPTLPCLPTYGVVPCAEPRH